MCAALSPIMEERQSINVLKQTCNCPSAIVIHFQPNPVCYEGKTRQPIIMVEIAKSKYEKPSLSSLTH